MKMQVTVCDMDPTEIGKPTTHYTITRDGERSEFDLCKDHGGPIETVLDKAYAAEQSRASTSKAAPVKKTAAKKTSTPRRQRAKVMTLEEIEALKTS
ncbi:hypothetical protein [Streptomyces phage phiScoe10]|nr:hypothetical protein [Streptomyces phage phiScoe10]